MHEDHHQHRRRTAARGHVDVHLLASVALTTGSALLTRDQRLHAAAEALGLAGRDAGFH